MYQALQHYFGYSAFRPFQEAIIRDVLDRRDVLVLMPTGGGKSLCYQLPAVMGEGLTVVISPLISLMKDQVDGLREMGIPAATVNSSMDHTAVSEVIAQVAEDRLKLLYVAPERFMIQDFLELLASVRVNLFAVDEAHCISEWGHDFRPEYRRLDLLKAYFPETPLIALTSTAVARVREDIIRMLALENPAVHRASIDRPNLYYRVVPKTNEMYEYILSHLLSHREESGIIYCQSRNSVEELAGWLRRHGIRALPYHAGLPAEMRNLNQSMFIRDDAQVMVATIAFGMGIDKPDVRYIIHTDLPRSVEGYYQETGRAGRDGLPGECILFFSPGDQRKLEYFIDRIEDPDYQRVAYDKMRDMMDFCTTRECRRAFLLEYFGEEAPSRSCAMCDICEPRAGRRREKNDGDSPTPSADDRPGRRGPRCDENLLGELRRLRKEIADRERVPPYQVFSDVVLREMATALPQDLKAMNRIEGVAHAKLRKYGERFLEAITAHCAANGIDPYALTEEPMGPHRLRTPSGRARNSNRIWTREEEWKLTKWYNAGKPLPEIAALLERKPGAVMMRLAKLGVKVTEEY